MLHAAPPLDLVEDRRQEGAGHERAGRALGHQTVHEGGRVEGLVVHEHGPRAPHQVGVQRLEAGGPLHGVEVQVDVVRPHGRRPGPEGVQVVEVVVDHREPRAVRLDPGLRVAGRPRGELEEAGSVLVDVQHRLVGRAAGRHLGEGHGPRGRVGPHGHEVTHAREPGAVLVHRVGEARVEDEGPGVDLVQRLQMEGHVEVAVQHDADECVLLHPQPGLHDLGTVVGEGPDAISPLEPEPHEAGADAVGRLVQLAEGLVTAIARQRDAGAEPLRRDPRERACLDSHGDLPGWCSIERSV